MGTVYKSLSKYADGLSEGTMVLEIGSDRYEGSTEFLAKFAQERNLEFHTVDIEPSSAMHRARSSNIHWHRAAGSEWCRTVLPQMDRRISVLYLDNFDYDWNILETGNWREIIDKQKAQYKNQFGLEMNNKNCQLEHATQMSLCLKFMADFNIVMFDDTYLHNDCWIGKNGPAVVWLQALGWSLAEIQDGGVILVKNQESTLDNMSLTV